MENELLQCKYDTLPPFPTYLRPQPPSDAIIAAIRLVAQWKQPEPEPCHFLFDISADAAAHNLHLLKCHDYDLEKVIQIEGGTPLQFGSEFKPPVILELLLGTHPLWNNIRSALTKGIQYPLARITCQDRRRDITAAIK